MIIVKIIGGLGNQMFQYAYAKALQQRGYSVKIDISAFETYKLHGGYQLNKYDIDIDISTKHDNNTFYKNNFLNKILRKVGINNSKILRENNLLFNQELLVPDNNKYIDGYFQCEKYFADIKNIILKEFQIKDNLSMYSLSLKDEIKNSINSCSIHIRRGDFVNKNNINIHGSCSLSYYYDSINLLNSKLKDMKYFIFSDDIEWVKINLEIENAIYVDNNINRIPHEDIYLMSLCKNNIIANSSFSWWGAWLNKNENKIVIAPKRWFADNKLELQSKDIVCKDWLKL